MALVQFGVIGVAGAILLDGVEDDALEFGLVALDEREVRRSPAAFFSWAGDIVRGIPLGVDGVGGDHGAVQVHVLQQGPP